MPAAVVAPTTRFRRASDRTAFRLGRAILGYLCGITLIITLAPFRFSATPVHGLTNLWDWPDLMMNIVMFVPIGFVYQLTRPYGARVDWLRVLALGAVLSGVIELAQLFSAARYTSILDWVTNTAGAVLGAWIYSVALKRIEGPNTVRTLALELPLMGLVYLLIPLMWLTGLASDGGSRAWLTLPIVVFAAGILGTIYAAYIEPTRDVHRGWLIAAALLWYVVALLPGTIRQRELLLAGAALVVGVAWLRSLATSRYRERHYARRFEMPTLRLVLPLFAAFLALSSLWPLDAADGAWNAILPLLPNEDANTTAVYVALEHVAAFTLVGYVIAEFHGRDLERYREIVMRVVLWGGGLTLLLEVARGFHPAYRASALMVIFTVSAAAFGGWLYQLQRDHVRALLTRRTSSAVHTTTASTATSFDRGAPALSSP